MTEFPNDRFPIFAFMIRLKLRFLFAALLFSCVIFASPKKPHRFPYYDDTHREPYLSLFTFASYITYKPQPGLLTTKFPYALQDRHTGALVTDTFSSSSPNLVGNGKWVYPGVGIEAGIGAFTVEGQIGAYIHHWSDNLYFGMNYRFVLHKFPVKTERYEFGSVAFPDEEFVDGVADFPVKISLGFFYYQPIWKLGEIDVSDKQFSALGYVMQSADTMALLGSTGKVTVLFHQNIIALTPNISLGYRPRDGRLDLSFRVSPFFTLRQTGGLRFYLKNNSYVDWRPADGITVESVIPLNTPGLDASFNNEKLGSTPFRFKCVMFTLRIGIRIA